MNKVLEDIAKALVEHPEDVSVTEVEKEDSTAKAIRTVVKAAASREDKRVVVEII